MVNRVANEEWIELEGVAQSGLGEGSRLTELDWVSKQFEEKLDIAAWPGTFNLSMQGERWQEVSLQLRRAKGMEIVPPEGFCRAKCFPVEVDGGLIGAVIFPAVPDYPPDKFEIVAGESVRDHLNITDGDKVRIRVRVSDPESQADSKGD